MLQLSLLIVFFINKKFLDLWSFLICIGAILVPIALEGFGVEEGLTIYIYAIFVVIIIVISFFQFKNFFQDMKPLLLYKAICLCVIAILYVVLYYYAQGLNTA